MKKFHIDNRNIELIIMRIEMEDVLKGDAEGLAWNYCGEGY